MIKGVMLTAASMLVSLGMLGNAQAVQEVKFTISDGFEPTESFETAISPTPVLTSAGTSFIILGTDATIGGTSVPNQLYGFTTYAELFDQSDSYILVGTNMVSPTTVGDANYFSGPVTSPTFVEGTYLATNVVDYTADHATATVTISAVPEVSTWAMMLIGFAGLGFAGYRQTKRRDDEACSAA